MAASLIGHCPICGEPIFTRDSYFKDKIELPIYMCVCNESVYVEVHVDDTSYFIERVKKFKGSNS